MTTEKVVESEVKSMGEHFADEEKTCGDCTCEAEPTLEPSDELEWLREQYCVLKQQNDSLRQAYSTVGQEASTLRRAMSSRMPTVRERAAIAALPSMIAKTNELIELGLYDHSVAVTDYAAACAVDYADTLVAALKVVQDNG